ncbi:MAG: hypothetical protein Q8M15_11300 [Bacteroidota bacterium]|nr:hypothetical protein [Bacteroidota bacterium]
MKKLFSSICIAVMALHGYSQNIGIGNTTPQSKLSVGASSQFQIDSIGNIKKINNIPYSFPASQGSSDQILTNNGSGSLNWTSTSGTAWGLSGNTGTSSTTNFIGINDSVALTFKVNNSRAGFIDSSTYSTFYGIRSGNSNTGNYNTLIGYQSLWMNTFGIHNTGLFK